MLKIVRYKKDQVKEIMPSLYNQYTHGAYRVIDEQKTVAEVITYVNPEIGKDKLLLGAYDAIDSNEVSSRLFKQVILDAKFEGFSSIVGPMNGSTWESYRFAHASDGHPFLLEPQQKDYFIKQWKAAGFKEHLPYYSTITTLKEQDYWNATELEFDNHFSAKNIRIEKWGGELDEAKWDLLTKFNNKAFANNPFFSSISKKEFKQKYQLVLKKMNTQFMYFATQGKELVGLLFAYPNILDISNKSLVLKTLARLPRKELKGMGLWLVIKFFKESIQAEYTHTINALMQVDNASTIRSNQFEGKLYRNYSLYKMELS